MGKLVVTIRPGGEVETLLKDKIFDTRVLGDRKIERVSEILPTDDGQWFYIRWLQGPSAGQTEMAIFRDYEDAVEYEVSTVNDLRLQGYSFARE
jgi:hypothetical protein